MERLVIRLTCSPLHKVEHAADERDVSELSVDNFNAARETINIFLSSAQQTRAQDTFIWETYDKLNILIPYGRVDPDCIVPYLTLGKSSFSCKIAFCMGAI
jgi:hypothetical protein